MWWRRKNKIKERASSNASDKAAGFIAHWVMKLQRGFAVFFAKRTAGFERRGKMLFLIAVCFVFGGLSFSAIVNVFLPQRETSRGLQPATISTPQHVVENDEPSADHATNISPEIYRKVQVFKSYMDSLQKTETGKRIHDSILDARPGFMDSVLFLEQIYSPQNQ